MDLINQHFGKLKVLQKTDKRKHNSVVWECRCDCGNIEYFSTKELRSDGIIQCSNCGNHREPKTNLIEDIVGKKFNHLTVIDKTDKRQSGKILYICKCDCESNKDVLVTRTDLINNHTTSCGCSKRKGKYSIGDIINNRKIIGLSEHGKMEDITINANVYIVAENILL